MKQTIIYSTVASALRMADTAPSRKAARFVTAATAAPVPASEAGSDTEVLAWYALQQRTTISEIRAQWQEKKKQRLL